jgi:hypothetical protein
MKQLEGNIEEGRALMNQYSSSSAVSTLQGDFYNSLSATSDSLSINLFDILERAISILPVAGDATGAMTSVVSVLSQAKKIFSVKKGAPRGAKVFAIKAVTRKARDLFKMITSSDDTNAVSHDVTLSTVVPISLDMLEELTNIIENYDAAYDKADNNYEDLSTQERQQVWTDLSNSSMLFTHPPGGFVRYVVPDPEQEQGWSLFAETKIRNLISQIILEESDKQEHNCDDHTGKTCEEHNNEIEEHSIGGYATPLASPANPKKFYKGMLDAYPGSHYVNDPPKSKS